MMFWGITLDSGKRYTQTVEKSFHLSMAALGFQNCSSMPVTVMVEVDKAQFAVCTLQPGKIPQQPLDYCFTEGEEITFFTEGPGDVHLTGYLIEEPNVLDFEDEEELSASTEESESASESSNSGSDDRESSSDEMTLGDLLHGNDKMSVDNGNDDNNSGDDEDDDWDPSKENPKRTKKTKKSKERKKLKKSEERKKSSAVFEQTERAQGKGSNKLCSGDDDDGDASDSLSPEKEITFKNKIIKRLGTKKGKKRKLQGEKAENKESVSNDTEEREALLSKKVKRKAKKSHSKVPLEEYREQDVQSDNVLVNNNLNTSCQDDSSVSINNSNGTLNSPMKGSSQNVKENPVTQQSSPDSSQFYKKTLPGGTEVEDIKKGKGKIAKVGQQVSVYYTGILAKNKKQFDACLTGKPLSFRLGAGEVIRGWDMGVAGMQVGGKRKLTIPPSQGYGNERTGPIPPNSTLEFQIQLVKLS